MTSDARGLRQHPAVQDGPAEVDHVEAVAVVHAAGHVGDGDDLRPPGHGLQRGPRADVAEALDGDAAALDAPALGLQVGVEHLDAAPPGGLLAARRAAEGHRLAGDDGRRVALHPAVGVHHPGHGLGVGADVGGGDVPVGAEDVVDDADEAPGQALQLRRRQRRGVDLDAALGPAEREVDQGRLPRHQRRQRPDLVEVGVGVVADAALVGPPGAVVLHPVAPGHDQLAVVQGQGDLGLDLAVAAAQDRVRACRRARGGGPPRRSRSGRPRGRSGGHFPLVVPSVGGVTLAQRYVPGRWPISAC